MKTVIVGLVLGLGGWLLAAVLVSAWLQWKYPVAAVDTIGISVFAGLLAWAASGLLLSAANRIDESRAIRRGLRGEAPRGGRHAVVVGVIEPVDAAAPLLRAPLDGSECVAYAYQMRSDSGTGNRRRTATLARGSALIGSEIRTRTGVYRLLAVPDLEGKPPTGSRNRQISRFQSYAKNAPFIAQKDAADELLRGWNDDDGVYRTDVRYTELSGADTRDWVPQQQHVPAGAPVCVFGRFDAAKGAILPSALRPVRLSCGKPSEVLASQRRKVIVRSLIGIALGAAAAGMVISFGRGLLIDG